MLIFRHSMAPGRDARQAREPPVPRFTRDRAHRARNLDLLAPNGGVRDDFHAKTPSGRFTVTTDRLDLAATSADSQADAALSQRHYVFD